MSIRYQYAKVQEEKKIHNESVKGIKNDFYLIDIQGKWKLYNYYQNSKMCYEEF